MPRFYLSHFALLLILSSNGLSQEIVDGRKVFTNCVVPLPDKEAASRAAVNVESLSPRHADDAMTILFSLAIGKEKQAELEQRVAKGEVIPPEEVQERYAVNQEAFDKLVGWLKDNGYKIKFTSPDRTSVYAEASVTAIQKSLQVQVARVFSAGLTYNAATNAPSLPEDVGTPVYAVIGLQPFRKAQKRGPRLVPINQRPTGQPAALTRANSVAPMPPFLVEEILAAYGGKQLGLTGANQTIAILIDTVPNDSDLVAFWQGNRVPEHLELVEKINVSGGALPAVEGEETLDVEWASGIAPRARVRIYACGSLEFASLDKALDQIIADLPSHPDLRQLSISLGLGETYMPGGPSGESLVEHNKFLRLIASGVNVFVSSGDAGSNPGPDGHISNGPLQCEYQTSDPFVISIGGTTLHLTSRGGVESERGWVGSGGGRSVLFPRPSYQTGPGIPSGSDRLVPDVALVADPQTGGYVVLNGTEMQYGGTSWSAPTWAAFCALINEARVKAHKPRLPFLNPILYANQGKPGMRDIVDGSNGEYKATGGYDLVTGLGVPELQALCEALTK